MQRRSWRAVGALTVAWLLAGCQDTPVAVPAGIDGTAARDNRIPHGEGYAERGERRTGYVFGRDGSPKRITYEVQGELAVWQGDIILGRARDIAASAAKLSPATASGVRKAVYIDGDGFRWPGGVVPYVIDASLTNTVRVTDAIAMVDQATAGVTFVVRTNEANYIRFQPSTGCSSSIGMVGGEQAINLDTDCSTGNAAHEILHALGLYHEHTRCDRDGFVTVNLSNVESGKAHNFDKQCDDASDHGDYDEGSMMHYSPFGFAVDPTIQTLTSSRGRDNLMGQRAALGPTDIATITFLYGANNAAPTADLDVSAPPYTEGVSVAFDGTGSSDPDDLVLTYDWNFGDGSCAIVPKPAKCTAAQPSHSYADDGNYTVTLVVSDGTLTDDATTSLTVLNAPPVVNAGANGARNEGQQFTQYGSFTDAGTDTWTATVDYGDGSGEQALTLTGKTFTLAHTYIDNGNYIITVTVSDDDGGEGSDDVAMTIANVVPVVNAGVDGTVVSGSNYTLIGGFTDAGVIDYPWAWTVNWGFGSNSTGSTNTQGVGVISAMTRACAAGNYQVNLAVKDKDNGSGSDLMTLAVTYFAVTIDITPTKTPNPINIGKGGLVAVAILSTPTFNATNADPSKITLGNEVGADTPVAKQNKGTYHAKFEDVNGDGRTDLIVMFEAPALAANGDIVIGTTQLVLRGFLSDGCTNFRGTDSVIILP
ncbi:M12 family metallopeptidase [Gemmatimonas sp.]|uniref:M12 family metallopeptidase n=1 Tax=Gemmatimonas sp. TaxID=1962908 RepID=UPI003983D897